MTTCLTKPSIQAWIVELWNDSFGYKVELILIKEKNKEIEEMCP